MVGVTHGGGNDDNDGDTGVNDVEFTDSICYKHEYLCNCFISDEGSSQSLTIFSIQNAMEIEG